MGTYATALSGCALLVLRRLGSRPRAARACRGGGGAIVAVHRSSRPRSAAGRRPLAEGQVSA